MEPELKIPREKRMFDRFPNWKLSDYYPDPNPVPELVGGEATVVAVKPSLSPDQLSRQLTLALEDARLVQQQSCSAFRGYATLNRRDDPKAQLKEWRFPVDKMPWVIEEAIKSWGHDHDLYIAQHSYTTKIRSTATLLSLNIAHIDLDIYKTDWFSFSRDAIVTAVLKRLEAWGIDLPSYIVWSGRGLQLKWLWNKPLSPKAEARWQTALRWLCEEVLADFGADVKATLPTQIMRLVGSRNLQGDDVAVIWIDGGDILNPVTYDFHAWADKVLPYTRAQVHEFKARMKQYEAWDVENAKNRAKLAADFPQFLRARAAAMGKTAVAINVSLIAAASIDSLTAGEIWMRRLDVMQQLLTLRGNAGVPAGEGQRHEWCWIAANAFGWVNRKQLVQLKADLTHWAKTNVPSYSRAEVMQAAASVLKRAGEAQSWGHGLYFMGEEKFRKVIGMTDAEKAQLAARNTPVDAPEQRWDIGAMGFEKMRGLTYEEYCAETNRRQSEAAHRTNELARTSNASHREKALQKVQEGLTQKEIAQALGVAQATVSKWTSTGKTSTEMREEARRLAREEGLTQVEIATRIGCSQATISRWLRPR